MSPHTPPPCSLRSMVTSLFRNRELIAHMTRREVVGRYKGSVLGLLWSFANPVFLLITYTFVFSIVFQAKWENGSGVRSEFAILLFVGMIVHGLFSETLIRAPGLVVNNVSYVKKIVFPLEILPVVAMGTSAFHSLVSLLVLAAAQIFIAGQIPLTFFLTPVVLFPLVVFALGIAWILASLGVYLRDVAQPIGLLMTVLLFASPVFYPTSALPVEYRFWMLLNPLTFIIEQARDVIVLGRAPNWSGLGFYTLLAVLLAWCGYVWFQKTRKGFANVL